MGLIKKYIKIPQNTKNFKETFSIDRLALIKTNFLTK